MLPVAIVTITLALVWYTVGAWAERIQGKLKVWHAICFGVGLACDATGTFLMTQIADERRAADVAAGPLNTLMAYSGGIALALMAIHLVWAIVVLARQRPNELMAFHRFSIIVWALWLVPYVAGAVAMIG